MFDIAVPTMKAKKNVTFFAWFICSIGAVFYCYEYLLRIAPSLMASELMKFYNLSASQYGDLTAYYYFAYAPMQLGVVVLVDIYGPLILLVFACLSCSIGAFMFGSSNHMIVAQVSRFLIGFGSAFAFVCSLKIATIWLPSERFALASGLITSLGMLGAMMGDMLLNHLIDYQGWRSTTFLSAWFGIALTFVILFFVRDEIKATKEIGHKLEVGFKEVCSGL